MNLKFSSSNELGFLMGNVSDPLFIIFPYLHDIFQRPSLLVLIGSIIFISSFVGIFSLIKKKKYFFPGFFLLSFIFLPRDYLTQFADLPIHYYRFISHIFVINIFIASYGLVFIFDKTKKLSKKSSILCKYLIISLIFIVSFVSLSNYMSENELKKYNFEDYDMYDDALDMLEFINEIDLEGRVAVKTYIDLDQYLGSPHFFSSLLPLEYNIPVIPGLLVESTLSSRFILPVLTKLGISMPWGDTSLLGDFEFVSQDQQSMLERLKLYAVEYILVDNKIAENMLNIQNDLEEIVSFGDFTLLKLLNFRPMIVETNYKPFLFIDQGGMNFIDFSKKWFSNIDMINYPVIYTNKNLEEISENDLSNIAGLIISYKPDTEIEKKSFEYFAEFDKNLIFIGAKNTFDQELITTKFLNSNDINEVMAQIIEFSGDPSEFTEVKNALLNDDNITFKSNLSTIINYSYFPKWKSTNPKQTVFWTTPSMMFIFGEDENILNFD